MGRGFGRRYRCFNRWTESNNHSPGLIKQKYTNEGNPFFSMIKLSDYVLESIAAAGVRDVFLVPGGAAMHLNDSLGKSNELSFVATFHEHAAAVAAEAYAKLSNQLGAVMVTAGPGSTNAITGVASAWVNSAPLIILSGQVKRADLNPGPLRQSGLQEIDIISIVSPITKYAVTVEDPESIRYHIEKAIHLATSGRPGPVWLAFPLDVQAAMVEPSNQRTYTQEDHQPTLLLERQVEKLIEIFNLSERPLVLAGYGIRVAGAHKEFLELLDVLSAPVQTTWIAADVIPFDHPLFAGRPGSFASRGANFAVQNADFLLAIGARFDYATTGYSRKDFARNAYRVAVDVDPEEIAKMKDNIDLGIVASADEVIKAILDRRNLFNYRDLGSWTTRIQSWLQKYPVVTPDLRGGDRVTSTYSFIEKLSEMLTDNDVIVEGSSGIHSEIFFMIFNVKSDQRIVADGSYGSMGYGLPAAIGACVAADRRRTILIEGDGSLQPNLQELETIVREHLPIKVFVVNNRGYSSIRASQSRYFQHLVAADATSGLTLPVIPKIAAGYGIRCLRIEGDAELEKKLREALEGDDPVICEIFVPEEEDRVPRLSSIQQSDGTMVSKPLEDLFPFLDREELRENMMLSSLRREGNGH